jgi:hypothetical protein
LGTDSLNSENKSYLIMSHVTAQDREESFQPQDLGMLTVVQLKQFLKARNVRSSGKKIELVKLAKLYYSSPVLRVSECDRGTDTFWDTSLAWKEVTSHAEVTIPRPFSIEVVTTYLSTVSAAAISPNLQDGEFEEGEIDEVEVDAGTEKPSVKGRRMYASEKLTLVEAVTSGEDLLFRGNCEASLRKSCRYPAVAISKDGQVVKGTCNCPANAGMKHLFLILHLVY